MLYDWEIRILNVTVLIFQVALYSISLGYSFETRRWKREAYLSLSACLFFLTPLASLQPKSLSKLKQLVPTSNILPTHSKIQWTCSFKGNSPYWETIHSQRSESKVIWSEMPREDEKYLSEFGAHSHNATSKVSCGISCSYIGHLLRGSLSSTTAFLNFFRI